MSLQIVRPSGEIVRVDATVSLQIGSEASQHRHRREARSQAADHVEPGPLFITARCWAVAGSALDQRLDELQITLADIVRQREIVTVVHPSYGAVDSCVLLSQIADRGALDAVDLTLRFEQAEFIEARTVEIDIAPDPVPAARGLVAPEDIGERAAAAADEPAAERSRSFARTLLDWTVGR